MQGRKPKCRCVTKYGLFAVFFLLGNPPNSAVGIRHAAAIIAVACAVHFLNGIAAGCQRKGKGRIGIWHIDVKVGRSAAGHFAHHDNGVVYTKFGMFDPAVLAAVQAQALGIKNGLGKGKRCFGIWNNQIWADA